METNSTASDMRLHSWRDFEQPERFSTWKVGETKWTFIRFISIDGDKTTSGHSDLMEMTLVDPISKLEKSLTIINALIAMGATIGIMFLTLIFFCVCCSCK